MLSLGARMSRNGRMLSSIRSLGERQPNRARHSAMLARADACFEAEREDFVRSVTDRTIKERLAAQLGDRHDLQRKALIEWSHDVERQLTLFKIFYASRGRT